MVDTTGEAIRAALAERSERHDRASREDKAGEMTQYERIRSVIVETLNDLATGPKPRFRDEGHASHTRRSEGFYDRKEALLTYCIDALAHYSTAEADVFLAKWREIRK